MSRYQLVQQGLFFALPGNSKVADLRQAFNFGIHAYLQATIARRNYSNGA